MDTALTALANEAIAQVIVHCDLLMETYEPVSMRGALNTLGFSPSEVEEILTVCAEAGFDYCLDPSIAGTHYDGNTMVTTYPGPDACYWGPDQLKSRLQSVKVRIGYAS